MLDAVVDEVESAALPVRIGIDERGTSRTNRRRWFGRFGHCRVSRP